MRPVVCDVVGGLAYGPVPFFSLLREPGLQLMHDDRVLVPLATSRNDDTHGLALLVEDWTPGHTLKYLSVACEQRTKVLQDYGPCDEASVDFALVRFGPARRQDPVPHTGRSLRQRDWLRKERGQARNGEHCSVVGRMVFDGLYADSGEVSSRVVCTTKDHRGLGGLVDDVLGCQEQPGVFALVAFGDSNQERTTDVVARTVGDSLRNKDYLPRLFARGCCVNSGAWTERRATHSQGKQDCPEGTTRELRHA